MTLHTYIYIYLCRHQGLCKAFIFQISLSVDLCLRNNFAQSCHTSISLSDSDVLYGLESLVARPSKLLANDCVISSSALMRLCFVRRF